MVFQINYLYNQSFSTMSFTALNYLNLPKDAINSSLGNTPSFLFYNNGNRFINPALSVHDYGSNSTIQQLSSHFTPLAWYWDLDEGKSYMTSINYSNSFFSRHALSLSLEYLDYGSLNLIDEDFTSLGKNVAHEINTNINYSYKIKRSLSVGIGATYLVSTLTSLNIVNPEFQNFNETSKILFNAGINYQKKVPSRNSIFNFGLAFLNLGSEISYDNNQYFYVPSKMNIYVNWKKPISKYHLISLTFQSSKSLIPVSSLNADEEIINDNTLIQSYIYNKGFLRAWEESFSDYGNLDKYLRSSQNTLALEYLYQKLIRGAISMQYQETNFGASYIMNLGLGVMINNLSFQLSYENPLLMDQIGKYPHSHTIRLSLLYTWSKEFKNQNLLCPHL